MAEAAPLTFDNALQALAAELAREQPTARRALDRPVAGQLPNIGPLPSRQEVRSAQPSRPSVASSPLEFFRGSGEQMARMTPEDQMNELGRTSDMARELTGAPGLLRAGDAVGDAAIDPSIPNLTDAGVRTGQALMRPAVALGSLGVGYASAAAQDLGLLDPSRAQAQERLPREQRRQLEAERQRAERDAVIQQRAADAQAGRERMGADAETERALKMRAATKDREAYDRLGDNADAAYAKEMARDKRFADTATGRVYEKTAGVTPFLAAAATGALARAAMKPSTMSNYVLPIGAGMLEGGVAANIPLATDAYLLPPAVNPARTANEAAARELPSGDPRRQRFLDNAALEDKENPVRSLAAKELYDPMKLAERTGIGVVEGGVGGFSGAKSVSLLGRGANALASVPGRAQAYSQSQQAAPPTTTAPLAGTLVEANGLSQRPTAGAASSADTLLSSGGVRPNGLSSPSQRQLPSPEASPNPRPTFHGAPLPPGVELDVNGVPYNVHTGHKVNQQLLTPRRN